MDRYDFDQLFAVSIDILAIAGLDGLIKNVNPAAERILGHPYRDLIDKRFFDYIHSDDHSIAARAVTRLASGEPAERFECRMLCRDGGYKWLAWSVAPGASGKLVYAVGRDTSGQKEAEAALRESEERYRLLVDHAPEAIIVHADGKIAFANAAAARLVGSESANKLVGLDGVEFVHPDFRADVETYLRQTTDSDQGPLVAENRFIRLDGSFVDVEVAVMQMAYQGVPALQVIARDVSERKRAQENLEHGLTKLRRTLEGTIDAMALTVETRDPYTAGHQQRVSQLATAIAKEMGLTAEQCDVVRFAAAIHDIGKISVPAEILSKPGQITPIEFQIVKAHPQVGHDILQNIEFPWPIAEIVAQHHERLDGSGYPRRLAAELILLEARILAVADVVEAMASHRPYRPALGLTLALQEVMGGSGKTYDAAVAAACLHLFEGHRFDWT